MISRIRPIGLISLIAVFVAAFGGAKTASASILLKPVPNNLGLVGMWNFNAGAGTSVADSSGSGNTGTWAGTGSHWTGGKFSNGGSFNGTDDYVTSGVAVQPTTALTVCAWVKTTNVSATSYIFTDGRDPTHYNSGFVFSLAADGKMSFWDYSDAGGGYGFPFGGNSNTALNNGSWHQACFTRSGTAGTYYLDGSPDGTKTANYNINYSAGFPVLYIGADGRSSASYFNGSIDDVRLYNRALSADEVKQLYSMGK